MEGVLRMKTFKIVRYFLIFTIICLIAPSVNALEITNINPETSGLITENSELTGYIPKTDINDQIISTAKYGTPMITLGDGSYPRVMIIAGVHGNELSPQLAALKLINDLENKDIKGTVYVIPFAIPYTTARNTRNLMGEDPSRTTECVGSPINLILAIAKQENIDYVGNFESTKLGGEPGEKSVLCLKDESYKSYEIAKYVEKDTGSTVYENAKDTKTLKNVFNLEGIPTVTCEVVCSHGKIACESVSESYKQMMALLEFSQVI